MKTLLLVVFLALQAALTKSPPHSIYIWCFKTKQKTSHNTSHSVCEVIASLGAAELVVFGLCRVMEEDDHPRTQADVGRKISEPTAKVFDTK